MADKKFISRKGRQEIYTRDQMICCYCLKQCIAYTFENWKTRSGDVATLDHIVSQWAIAKASESPVEMKRRLADPHNLVVVCNSCNASKQETELYIWASFKGFDYNAILGRISARTA